MKPRVRLSIFLFSFILFLAVLANGRIAYHAHALAHERASIRKDYSDVNSINNGLLSVTVWRDNLQRVAASVITDFSFSDEQEAQLKAQVSNVLNAMISEAEHMVNNPNSFKGKMQKVAASVLVNWDNLRDKVPVFTQTIMDQFDKPENKEKMKSLLIQKLNQFAVQTHDGATDSIKVNTILAKYSAVSVADFNAKTAAMESDLTKKTFGYSFAVLATMVAFLLLWIVVYKRPHLHRPLFIFSVMVALIALFTGLTSPMIEIDARINSVSFSLLGQQVLFNDQIIFYQSKSILDIVRILLLTHKVDSMLVGVLLLSFSIVFPITKLISVVTYLLGGKRLKNNTLIKFFVFKSGKWSMADVFCVAIFMAYIGFNGILNDQLKVLNVKKAAMTSIATNLTSLQPGFTMFVSFVLFGLVLAEILKRVTAHNEKMKGKITHSDH